MASTIKISDTLNWLTGFISQRPTTGVGGIANEPALTSANKVLQTMISPPFIWPWNRAETTFVAPTGGTTDKSVAISTWGFLEKATISGGSLPGPKEIEVYQVLSTDTAVDQPQKIAPIFDDNAGNITFRLMPAADAAYTVTLTFQKSAALFTATSGFWSPFPDKLAYLYEQGMLAHMQAIYAPQLYFANIELFFRQLVGAAEGLTETEKNIFLADRLRDIRTEQNAILGAQNAKRGRG